MSEQNAEVLDYLRASFARVDERSDKIHRQLHEHTERFARLETMFVATRRDYTDALAPIVGLEHRFDGIETRLDRIERRLDLVVAP
jgi:tetrahydromethanopterin S-methyltransferase subunit G